jgi:competence protein ComEC
MEMKLTFVNVGYGEAILLECPDDRFPDGTFVMLIDGGSALPEEYEDRTSGRIPLAEYLADQGHIDLMVSTHVHEDHLCGLLRVARLLPPKTLWQTLPPPFCRSVMGTVDISLAQTVSQRNFLRAINDCQELCCLVEETGGTIEPLRSGAAGQLCEGLRYQVLAPGGEKAREQEDLFRELFAEQDKDPFLRKLSELDARMNNYSLILLLEYQGTRLLLPGDTNCLGYGTIDPAALSAHLFKVGHHGQRDGASRELLDLVRPEAVVCCASSDRRYDSAHPDTLNMITESGATLYFSDCPKLPGLEIPPHRALIFTVGENGRLDAQYMQ